MSNKFAVFTASLLAFLSVAPAFADYGVLPTKIPANVFLRDGTKPMTAPLDLGSHRVVNVTNPSDSQDAATKSYTDAIASGLNLKQSVRGATTANITLSGLQTIDGVSLIAGDRELVKDQTVGNANGIYVVSAGAWSRAVDADVSAEVTAGMFTFVEEGTVNADQGWTLATNNPIVLGTTALTFTQFSAAGSITPGNGLTQTGPSLDVVGTAGRISVSADAIDIDPTYVASIAQGGTAATTAAGAPFALKGANTDLTSLAAANILSSGTEFFNGAGTFTATGNYGLVSCSGGSAATLNLPAYVANRKLTIKVRASSGSGSGSLNVARQGSDLILVNGNLVSSTTVASYQTATFQAFDGSLIGAPGLTVWLRFEPTTIPVSLGGTGSQYYGVPYRGVSTNNYAITLDDYMIGFQVDTIGAGGASTIPSPATAPAGKKYIIHTGGNTSNTITITSPGNGFVDLNGVANAFPSITLANNEVLEIFGDSGYWRVNTLTPVDRGGTGLSTAGSTGNVLTSNGTNWVSSPPASQLPQGFTGNPTKRIIWAQPAGLGVSSYVAVGGPSGGANLGTAPTVLYTTVNNLLVNQHSTTTATNDKSGMRWNDSSIAVTPASGYAITATIVTGPNITNCRTWVNLTSSNSSFPTSTLTSVPAFGTGFRYDTSASDSTWKFCSSDGGVQTVSDTTLTVAPNTTYTFFWYGNTTTSTGSVNGSAPVTNPTNNPSAGSSLSFQAFVENLDSSVKTIYVSRSYCEN